MAFPDVNLRGTTKIPIVYPRLFDKRGAVRFTSVPGEYKPLDGTDEDLGPIRFAPVAKDQEGPLQITKEEMEEYHELESAISNQTSTKESFTVGLQSGTRSALIFENGQMIRIKGAGGGYTGTQQKLFMRAGGVRDRCLESFVIRELDTMNALQQHDRDLLAYDVKGVIQYEEMFRGHRLMAPVFACYGDTRLDYVLGALSIAESISGIWQRNNTVFEFIDQCLELSFELGQIAGMRFLSLQASGIPWSRRGRHTNAHFGNMVVYESSGDITIGLVDFDASGISLGSKKRHGMKVYEKGFIFRSLKFGQPMHSLPTNHPHFQMYGGGEKIYTAFREGFKVGFTHDNVNYHKPVLESTNASFFTRVLGLATAFEHQTRADLAMGYVGASRRKIGCFAAGDRFHPERVFDTFEQSIYAEHQSYKEFKEGPLSEQSVIGAAD